MNKAILMGRLTKDPEIRYSSDKAVARYSIAVDRKYNKDEADFFNLVSFGKQAEFVEKYLKKGTKIAVSGRIENSSYEKDGKKMYSTQIIVEDVEFAESKKEQPKKEDNEYIPDDIVSDLPFH